MSTTLDIDDDVLQAAKELARREHKTAGRILSDLARRGLTQEENPSAIEVSVAKVFLGFVRSSGAEKEHLNGDMKKYAAGPQASDLQR